VIYLTHNETVEMQMLVFRTIISMFGVLAKPSTSSLSGIYLSDFSKQLLAILII